MEQSRSANQIRQDQTNTPASARDSGSSTAARTLNLGEAEVGERLRLGPRLGLGIGDGVELGWCKFKTGTRTRIFRTTTCEF